jgi:drug/metabolite transporter (DMT)-like permease
VESGLVRGLAALLVAGAFSLGVVALEAVAESSDDPQSVADYAAVLAVSAALLGAATALAFLRRFGARRSRRAGNLALAVAGVGAALAGVGNGVELGLGVSAFELLFALGAVALLLGLLIAGVSVLTAPAPWRWAGLALVLLAVGTAVGEEPGFVLLGVTWIVLAALLAARSGPLPPERDRTEPGEGLGNQEMRDSRLASPPRENRASHSRLGTVFAPDERRAVRSDRRVPAGRNARMRLLASAPVI